MAQGVILTDFYAGQPGLHQRAVGAYHIASVLRERGLNVQVIDFVMSLTGQEIENIVERTIAEDTRFIGLSTTFMYAKMADLKFNRDFEIADPVSQFILKAKERNSRIKVFQGGGYHFQSHPLVDHWMPGQYVENEFISVLNQVCDLKLAANFEFVEHHFRFEESDNILRGETLPLEVSRGCIFSCKFCSFSGRGKKVNTNIKRIELIESYMRDCYARFGTRNFYLADDTFNESVAKIRSFLEMVRRLDFQPMFCCYLRIDLLIRNPEMLPLLFEAGVRGVAFGIETFHIEAGRAIGKATSPETVRAFLQEAKQDFPEMYFSSGFIVGLPGEPLSSVAETNEWLVKSESLDSWHFAPLVIDNELRNPNPSHFSKTIESYGYQRSGQLGWEREDLSFEGAGAFCSEMNSSNRSRIGPSPWILFGTLRDREFQSVRKTKIEEMETVLDHDKFDLYKTQLFESI